MMYVTEIIAISPITGSLITFAGPNVPGVNIATAQEYCQANGLGYCNVIGKLVMEIPCKEGTHIPDMKGAIDYDNINMN